MPKTNGRPPFGYKHGANGYYEIVETSAAVIRRIFNEYLKQKPIRQITRKLNEEGIKSSRGVKWDHSIVSHILKNKKYCGNENYAGIISEEVFLKAQELRKKRFEKSNVPLINEDVWKYNYPFTSIIICGQCGEKFIRAVNSSGKRCQKRTWRCRKYVKEGVGKCDNTSIPEKILEEAFYRAYNRLQRKKENYLKIIEGNKKVYAKNKELEILFDESIEMLREASINRSNNINEVNKNTIIILQKKMDKLWRKIEFDEIYYNNLRLKKLLEKMPYRLNKFDSQIFKIIVEKIVALKPGVVRFYFINGTFIEEYYETKAVRERRNANGKEGSNNSSKNNTGS